MSALGADSDRDSHICAPRKPPSDLLSTSLNAQTCICMRFRIAVVCPKRQDARAFRLTSAGKLLI